MTFAAAMLAVSALIAGYLYSNHGGAPASATKHAATAPASAHPAATPLVPEVPTNVDFAADAISLADLSPNERADQCRDWLLFAAASSLLPSADELGRIFFDMPSVRHGYLRPVGTFEFGPTRSRYIGDGNVLALVPAGSDAAQRREQLTSIADQQRKNLGGEFKQLLVFEYTLDAAHGARLTRRASADVSYARLFSPEFGYQERTLASLDDLKQFMGTVDDLTFARKTADSISVGGRKLSTPRASITVEQVATVWQAEQEIKANRDKWESYVHGEENAFNARWTGRKARAGIEFQMLEKQRDEEWKTVEARIKSERSKRKIVPGSGFSLDPQVDFLTLLADFDAAWPAIEKKLGSAAARLDHEKVSAALVVENIGPYVQLAGQLKRSQDFPWARQAGMLLDEIQYADSFQAARYDGALQGTEVGMTLFYTDLLAKLWVIDYLRSSPSHDIIPAFVDDPASERTMSLVYEPENDKLSAARLWFGPQALGYQVADSRNTLLFARSATRIFSAGQDPEHPGTETQTGPLLANATDWWNDHYEEVAAYEPRYQSLNEIMKWSALIGWLNGTADGDRLKYLADVNIDRSQVFNQWVRRHPELRFARWSTIDIKPPGYNGSTTEAMPLLRGPVTVGGVSLADRTLGEKPPLAPEFDELIRRSNLDYVSSNGKTSLTTFDRSVFEFSEGIGEQFKVTSWARPDVEMRGPSAQFKSAQVERSFTVRPDGVVSLETRIGHSPIGDLVIERDRNGFGIGWRARAIERAQDIARRLSLAKDPDAALLGDATVETLVRMGKLDYAVKLRSSPEWIRLAPQKEPLVDIDPAWQLRASGPSRAAHDVMQARVMEASQLFDELRKAPGHLVVESDDDGRTLLAWSSGAPAKDGRTVSLQTSKGTLEVRLDPASGAIEFDTASDRLEEALATARVLRAQELAAIRDAAAQGAPKVVHIDLPEVDTPLGQAFAQHDYRKAARSIADDPVAARRTMSRGIADDVARNREIRASHGVTEALHDLDLRIAARGPVPELLLRRALLQIERGNVADAVETAGRPMGRALDDRSAFFDEINAVWTYGDADMRRFAQFVDASDRATRQPMHAPGTFHPYVQDGHLDFDLTLAKMDDGVVIDDSSKIDLNADSVVYHPDVASLNKVDWSAPVHDSLKQVIDGHLGKVIRLSDENIASYRPAHIWSPDHQQDFKPAPKTSSNVRPVPRYAACGASVQQAGDDARGSGAPAVGCGGTTVGANGQPRNAYVVVPVQTS
jgi:hypothetical protein